MLDLSYVALMLASNADVPMPRPRPAVIYHVRIAPPIPYAHLDWSRATNPQYNIMMNNIESMVPKATAERHETTVIARQDVPKEEPKGLTDAGKRSVTIFAALMVSAVILRLLLRPKPV